MFGTPYAEYSVRTHFFPLAQDTVSLTQTGTITAALLDINLRIFRQHRFESLQASAQILSYFPNKRYFKLLSFPNIWLTYSVTEKLAAVYGYCR